MQKLVNFLFQEKMKKVRKYFAKLLEDCLGEVIAPEYIKNNKIGEKNYFSQEIFKENFYLCLFTRQEK